MGYAELQYYLDKPVDFVSGMQFYGFVDGGVVSDIGTAVNDGSLFSAGGGVRVDITRRLDVDLELAVPLSGPRFDSDGSTPKVNLSVSQDF
jgi:hemolysin activation/secretion protein